MASAGWGGSPNSESAYGMGMSRAPGCSAFKNQQVCLQPFTKKIVFPSFFPISRYDFYELGETRFL